MDADMAAVLQAIASASPTPPERPAYGDIQAHRNGLGAGIKRLYEAGFPKQDASIKQEDFHTASADGHTVLLRWYSKTSGDITTPSPAVLYVHSGGMIMGEVAAFDNLVHNYVSKTGVPFLSVEYRLSPEVRYPKALEDVYAGLTWLRGHTAELGVDPRRVGVMGESAGGALAAAVCIRARGESALPIAKQLLVYPMLDDRNVAAEANVEPLLTWSALDNRTGWDAYLGADQRGTDVIPATAAPARVMDATGLPPVYMEVGELDLFREEDIEYARKHWRAGVSAELHIAPGLPHGYDMMAAKAPATQEVMRYRIRAIASLCKV